VQATRYLLRSAALTAARVAFAWATEKQSNFVGHVVFGRPEEVLVQVGLLRDIFGNPFRPVAFAPEWRSDTALTLARQMYEASNFSALPILADALQDAGRDNEDVLNHCRGAGVHVRGCCVMDLVLGRE
jgi:hypothetical protein